MNTWVHRKPTVSPYNRLFQQEGMILPVLHTIALIVGLNVLSDHWFSFFYLPKVGTFHSQEHSFCHSYRCIRITGQPVQYCSIVGRPLEELCLSTCSRAADVGVGSLRWPFYISEHISTYSISYTPHHHGWIHCWLPGVCMANYFTQNILHVNEVPALFLNPYGHVMICRLDLFLWDKNVFMIRKNNWFAPAENSKHAPLFLIFNLSLWASHSCPSINTFKWL